jgi:calcium/calmodulin-dependent protein kinase I
MWGRISIDSDVGRRESADSCCSSDSEAEHSPSFSVKRLLRFRADGAPQAKYRFSDEIGRGSFGRVRIIVDKKTKVPYACKVMRFTRSPKVERDPGNGARLASYTEVMDEVESMCDLNHPALIQLHEYFEVGCDVYMVLDLMRGGSLCDELYDRGSFSEEDTRVIFRQLLRGIQCMHSNGVVHRDIKLDNIMLAADGDFSSVTLVDFGFACRTAGKRLCGCMGTPKYVAPEVLRSEGKKRNNAYGKECDLWSLGVVLYILLSGYPPFTSSSFKKSLSRTLNGDFNFSDPVWEFISEEAKDLITLLLAVDPTSRLTPAEALAHAWLRDD